ncbi:Protein associated with topo II related - 1 [Carabus blaptoides fortunei]
MANTFFGFNTALNDHAERLGSSPEDIEGLEAEQEYDALNDETFGALGDEAELDDWEVQHEQLAEIAESSRHSNDIESFLDNLGLNDEESVISKDKSVWAYNSDLKNGDKLSDTLNESILDSSVKLLPPLLQNDGKLHTVGSQHPHLFPGQSHSRLPSQVQPKLRTVEELERMLLNQSAPQQLPPQHNNQPAQTNHQPLPQQIYPQQPHGYKDIPGPPRYPPGFQPMVLPPAGHPPPALWHLHQHHHGHQMPPGLVRMMGGPPPGARVPPPHLLPPGGPAPPPGFMYPHHGPGFPMNPHFNFPPPPRVGMPPNMQQNRNNQYNRQRLDSYKGRSEHQVGPTEVRDEYAGLMNNREKQWLLNIQLLQVNTGTPYFDDYYYTVFKERQAKNKENVPENRNNQRYHNNRYQQHGRDGNAGHHHRNQGQDNRPQDASQNPLNKKVYTPLQFENSLGKLQFGSVTAPRKIIDMDIITLEKDSESTQSSRDSRKTKQLLLELEALYTLILKVEDLKNPVAISNSEKLLELKQKQRLREMDAAPTPEQKQEVLKLLQQESLAPPDNQAELLARIVSVLLQDDKLASFAGIRKGKMLLLRVLPQLSPEVYLSQLVELWEKLLLSIPLIGRRDTIGDNILPRFFPHFKRFLVVPDMDQILDIVSGLKEVVKLENSRSTPLGHQSKSPLHFIVSNKFGVSAVTAILQRVDTLLDTSSEKQAADWSHFLTSLAETLALVGPALVQPLEPITEQTLTRHVDKHGALTPDKRQLLQKAFVDSN